jgi:hypothetical protein
MVVHNCFILRHSWVIIIFSQSEWSNGIHTFDLMIVDCFRDINNSSFKHIFDAQKWTMRWQLGYSWLKTL